MTGPLPGAVPSPNIWSHPETYELENRSVDPDGVVEAAMTRVLGPGGWAGRDVLDVGCGTGFHLSRWADGARSVHGVEPHPALAALAGRRTRRLENVTVHTGTAQDLPLPPASIDVAQARWAYFFGPGCEPGLAELARVVRRGGTAFVLDTDATRSTFGAWFARGHPSVDPVAVQRFWTGHGWQREQLDLVWRFTSRADLESVLRLELPPRVAEDALAGHLGTTVDCAVDLWWKRF